MVLSKIQVERLGRASGGVVTSTVSVLLAIALPVHFAGVAAAAATVSASGSHEAGEWQPYDAAEVAKLNAAGRPLLVNFTASWCLTCLINEAQCVCRCRRPGNIQIQGSDLDEGRLTNRDPAITRALAAFGRAGVPLYLVYNSTPGSAEPVVLPQLLTAGVVRDAFANSPRRD